MTRAVLYGTAIALSMQSFDVARAGDNESGPKERKQTSGDRLQVTGKGPAAMLEIQFERMDENGDGKIDLDEFLVPTRERFHRIDANGDGTVDRREMMAAREQLAGLLRDGPLGTPGDRFSPRPESPQRRSGMGGSSDMGGTGAYGEFGSQRPGEERLRQMIQSTQFDKEGRIVVASVPEPMRQRLAQLDANSDGFIDFSEGGPFLTRLQEARKERSQGKQADRREKDRAENGRGSQDRQGPQKPKRPAEEKRD